MYQEGTGNDITFTLTDNVKVSTNKFMLACRTPYFAKMFEGEEKELKEKTLQFCDSKIFKRILDLIFEGEMTYSDLDTESLNDLMEAARIIGMKSLVKNIEDYIKHMSKQEENIKKSTFQEPAKNEKE